MDNTGATLLGIGGTLAGTVLGLLWTDKRQAARDRKVAGERNRSAARLVAAELLRNLMVVNEVLDKGQWEPTDEVSTRAWETHNSALALVLEPGEFAEIDGLVHGLKQLEIGAFNDMAARSGDPAPVVDWQEDALDEHYKPRLKSAAALLDPHL